MARRPRTFGAGLLYHVMARGNHREPTFLDADDYQAYLHRLALYQIQHAVTLYTYCLMPNHVHLLVRAGAVPLAKFMQGVQQSYTQRFNRVHGQVGHVFQGRYRAIVCDDDPYLLTLVRYIHLNPIRAGLADDLASYAYSGHHAYVAGRVTAPVDPSAVLAILGGPSGYRRLMGAPWTDGDPSPARAHRVESDREAARGHRGPGPAPLACEIDLALDALAAAMGLAAGTLRDPDRRHRVARGRALATFVLVRVRGYRLVDVARALNHDPDVLGTALGRLAARLDGDAALRQEAARLAQWNGGGLTPSVPAARAASRGGQTDGV